MIEWEVPFKLETPLDTDLIFNDPDNPSGYFKLLYEGCKATRTLRNVIDKIPQGDGEIFHTRFRDGTEIQLAVALWENENDFACDAVLREMYEELVAHLDAILNGGGRLLWQPSDYGSEWRMLESARWLNPIEISWDQGVAVCTFGLDSPFPYLMDLAQEQDPPGHTTMNLASNAVLVEAGVPKTITLPAFSAPFWPVMQIRGPLVGVVNIENTSVTDEYGTNLRFRYNSDRPGAIGLTGSQWAEIDTFRETIYLDSNLSNMKPGVDPEVTDFFYLKPGDNIIEADSCDVDFLINHAWVPG